MTPDPEAIEAALAEALEDHRLSRAERAALLPALTALAATAGRGEIDRKSVV